MVKPEGQNSQPVSEVSVLASASYNGQLENGS